MRFFRAGLVPVVLLACASLNAQTFFLHGSDPQFGMYSNNKNFLHETANFEFFIANANRLKPAFVVLSGDLINLAGNPGQTAEFQRIAKKLDPAIKLYCVPGNHDVKNQPTHESLAVYRRNFGPDWYSFQNAGVYGIVLNSSVISFPAGVEDEAAKQEAWLRAELTKAEASGLRVAIFQHIPWFTETPDEADQYFNIPKQNRARYLDLLRQHHVQYCFAGHTHREYDVTGGGLHLVIATGLSIPLGPEPSGFHVVSIGPAGLEAKYFSLGNVPDVWPVPAAVK